MADVNAVADQLIAPFTNGSTGKNYYVNSGNTSVAHNLQNISITDNVEAGPFGGTTGDRVVSTTTSSINRRIQTKVQPLFAPAGVTTTASFLIKYTSMPFLTVYIFNEGSNGEYVRYRFNIQTGVIDANPVNGSVGGVTSTAQIERFGDWYRVSINMPRYGAAFQIIADLHRVAGSINTTTTSGEILAHIDAFQVEYAPWATKYSATGATAPTQNNQGALGSNGPAPATSETSVTIDPFISNASVTVPKTLIGNNLIAPFTNTSDGNNKQRYSEALQQSFTQTGGINITDNFGVAPTGITTTATRLSAIQSSSSVERRIYGTLEPPFAPSSPAGQYTTYSFYVRPGSCNFITYYTQFAGGLGGGNYNGFTVDLTTGTVVNVNTNLNNASTFAVTAGPNGFWRIATTMIGYTNTATFRPIIDFHKTAGQRVPTASSGEILGYVTAFQAEWNPRATTYSMTGATAPTQDSGAKALTAPVSISDTQTTISPFMSNGVAGLGRLASFDGTFANFTNVSDSKNSYPYGTLVSMSHNNPSDDNMNITDNVLNGPAGLMSYYRPKTTSNTNYITVSRSNGKFAPSGPTTFSFYARAGSLRYLRLLIQRNDGAVNYCQGNFDITAGTFLGFDTNQNNCATANIEGPVNGIVRISFTMTGLTGAFRDVIYVSNTAGFGPVASSTSTILFYAGNFQAESGPIATDYVDTGATAPTSESGAKARALPGQITATGDNTIAPFTANSTVLVERLATGSNTIAPFMSNGVALYLPVRSAVGDDTVGPFVSNGSSINANPANLSSETTTFNNFYNTSTGRNYLPNSKRATLAWASSEYTFSDNVGDSPVGQGTADAFVARVTGNNRQRNVVPRNGASFTANGLPWTFSCYILGPGFFRITFADFNDGNNTVADARFNMDPNAVQPVIYGQSAAYTARYQPLATVTDAGNGWRRLALTVTGLNTGSMRIQLTPAASQTAFGTDASVGDVLFYGDGYQWEQNTFASSYEPTDATVPLQIMGASGLGGAPTIEANSDGSFNNFTSNAVSYLLPILELSSDGSFDNFFNTSQGYNLFVNSRSTGSAFSATAFRIVDNSDNSPLGVGTADYLQVRSSGTTSRALVLRGSLSADGNPFVFSFYLVNAHPFFRITFKPKGGGSSYLEAYFNTYDGRFERYSGSANNYADLDPIPYVFETGEPSPFAWRRYGISFTNLVANDIEVVIYPTDSATGGPNSTANVNDNVMFFDGWQYETGRVPRLYQPTDTVAPPNVIGATATSPLPKLYANTVEQTIEPFLSDGSAIYVNLANADQTLGTFTQDARVEYTRLRLTGESTFGEFTMNLPGSPTFAARGALMQGQAATTRDVFPAAETAPGDLMVLFAGIHSDGLNDAEVLAEFGWTAEGSVSAPSDVDGYYQSLWMWTKTATEFDLDPQNPITLYYDLPTDYKNPVVWAQARTFKNALRVESFVTSVTQNIASFSQSPAIYAQHTDRLAVLVWQIPGSSNTGGYSYWTPDEVQRSSLGPGFTTITETLPMPEPGVAQKSRNWSKFTRGISMGFTVVPNYSEGDVVITATADQSLGEFLSIKDIHANASTQIDTFISNSVSLPVRHAYATVALGEFLSVGRSIPAAYADSTIEPFTSDGFGAVETHANTVTTFDNFTSLGFQNVKMSAANQIAAFASTADAQVTSHLSSSGFLDEFISNAASLAFITANTQTTFDNFRSGRVTLTANTTTFVPPYTSHGLGNVFITANTTNVIVSAFTADTDVDLIANLYSEETTFNEFKGDSIISYATSDTYIDPFIANSIGQVVVTANTETTFDNFTQDAGNLIFIDTLQTLGEFISESMTNVVISTNTATTIADFRSAPVAELSLFIKARGQSRIGAITQNVLMPIREPTIEMFGDNTVGEFESDNAQAYVSDRPRDHGGVKFKGSFKGGLKKDSFIRIWGKRRN